MLLQHAAEKDKRSRMEVEANRFSSLLLMPPPMPRSRFKGDPNLKQITDMAAEFEVSKEAMARAYSSQHHEVLACVVTHNNIVRRVYKHIKFPYVTANFGKPAPLGSLVGRNVVAARGISEIQECLPDLWISVDRGKPAPKLFEQVMNQRDGYAMTLLWIEARSEDDEEEFDRDENLTSAQRYRDRIHRNSR